MLKSGSIGCLDDVSSLYPLPKSISVERLSSHIRNHLVPYDASPTTNNYYANRSSIDSASSDEQRPDVITPSPRRLSLARALLAMFGKV